MSRAIITESDVSHGKGADRLHLWWELSYAQYLTIPRTAMQSMDSRWQGKMARLLDELDERIDWRPKEGRYYVTLRRDGPAWSDTYEVPDPLADYERGWRRLPWKPTPPFSLRDHLTLLRLRVRWALRDLWGRLRS